MTSGLMHVRCNIHGLVSLAIEHVNNCAAALEHLELAILVRHLSDRVSVLITSALIHITAKCMAVLAHCYYSAAFLQNIENRVAKHTATQRAQ